MKPSSADLATGLRFTAHLRTPLHLSHGFELDIVALYQLSYRPLLSGAGWI